MIQVIIFRLGLSLFILRFPLFGAILAIFVDFIDLRLLSFFSPGDLESYQQLDKTLDLFYLALEAYVALSFKNKLVRIVCFILFLDRFVGAALFQVFQSAKFLVIFPNVFEPFYLLYLLHLKFFKKDYFKSLKIVMLIIVMITIPKLFHEYLLHINTDHPWSENEYVKILTPDFMD